jgi:2-C-methyl-D-erythritol 4-phosphate cytidylyltransferase
MKISAVILAGGKGTRFGSSIPKPFMSLNGKAVIQYSIDVFEPLVDEIIIVSNTQYKDYKCIPAGATRSESAYNGTKGAKGDYVIIHDGARPFIRAKTIGKMIRYLGYDLDCIDTIAPIIDGFFDNGKFISKQGKFLGLTPEGFNRKVLLQAFRATPRRDWQDEVTMVHEVMEDVQCGFVRGESFNTKITYERDLAYAEGIMKFWAKAIDTCPDLNKNTLVFGGSSGIGKGCVEKLPRVVAPTRQQIDLSKDWEVDLTDFEAIIYSAGEYANEDLIMKVNFDSFVHLVKQAEEQDWQGNIVALSSTASTFGRKGIPVYSASKSALNAYIEARHEELADKGIYINAIAPAKTDTRLQESINPNTPKSEMMTVDYVTSYVLRYIDTTVHGHIIFLRKGFDV